MKTVEVKASKNYKVYIENGLINKLGEYLKSEGYKHTAIITDDIVDAFYSERVENSLKSCGISYNKYVIKNGEASKNADNYIKLINFLADNHFTRSDVIIALGGGVVGDLSGFTASTYLRGIACAQVPTTILAAVDSSVGGKTAIDIEAGKNLCGTFYQPNAVFCDPETFKTLPCDIFRDGCAEIIKYGAIDDVLLLSHLEKNKINFDIDYVVEKCVSMKRDIVTRDEYDTGERQLLNFGHTVGHAIEICSNFEISHGSAVALGMCIIARACAAEKICSQEDADKLISIIKSFGFSVKTEFTAEQLAAVMLMDKKRFGNSINLIILKKYGKCEIEKMPISLLKDFINKGM